MRSGIRQLGLGLALGGAALCATLGPALADAAHRAPAARAGHRAAAGVTRARVARGVRLIAPSLHDRQIRGLIPVVPAGTFPVRAAGTSSPDNGQPVLYHGGPVLHGGSTFAIFWAPSGYTFPAGYEDAVRAYLKNGASVAGGSTNVYAVTKQYTDNNGSANAAPSASFAGSLDVTDAYPTGGCVDSATPGVCFTDAQLQAELAKLATADDLPTGMGTVFFVFTPPNVGSCIDSSPNDGCAYTSGGYCAYHGNVVSNSAEILYANMPDADVSGCRSGQYPNGSATGVDPTLDALSHEHSEMITDPLAQPGAWYDAQGYEVGDKCQTSYGATQGAAGSEYNQVFGPGRYYLQFEWSNAAGSCAGSWGPTSGGSGSGSSGTPPPTPHRAPSASFTESSGLLMNASFDATGSTASNSQIADYFWDFGDGNGGSGVTVRHAYTLPGTYTVTLTVIDGYGSAGTVSKSITVSPTGGLITAPQARERG